MKTALLEKLLVFYEEDPDAPFNLYALALEYQKFDTSRAAECYERLLNEFSSYLPTYYHAAQFFWHCELYDKARETYKRGIELADEQHNTRTFQELTRAYLTFEDDQLDD